MDLRTALVRVFPSARGVEVTVPVEDGCAVLSGRTARGKHGAAVDVPSSRG